MSFQVRRLADQPKKRKKLPWKRLFTVVSWVGIPAFRLFESWRRKRAEEKKAQEHRVTILGRVLITLIVIFCAALAVVAGVKALVSMRVLSVSSVVSVTASKLPTDAYGHTNILLLGEGDKTHDGLDLTDSIMVASIDATNKSVAMLSLPRDLYLLKTDKMGAGRINTLYRDYKGTLVEGGQTRPEASRNAMMEIAKELGTVLGVEIHHVIKVDFSGFTQAVDAVGGIYIDVPQDLVDPEYPASETGYTTFTLLAGQRHLDGETALKYARSRHSTSDFDRSRRQQQILTAIGDDRRDSRVGSLRLGLVVIGAIQIVPGIIRDVAELQLYQRTPPWVVPRRARRPACRIRCSSSRSRATRFL